MVTRFYAQQFNPPTVMEVEVAMSRSTDEGMHCMRAKTCLNSSPDWLIGFGNWPERTLKEVHS